MSDNAVRQSNNFRYSNNANRIRIALSYSNNRIFNYSPRSELSCTAFSMVPPDLGANFEYLGVKHREGGRGGGGDGDGGINWSKQ